jgi:hypothetical protein
MAVGCEYFVNGEWITESQFKDFLFSGLLDQLIVNEGVTLEGFIPDPNNVPKIDATKKPSGIRIPIRNKSNRVFNNSREVDEFGNPTNEYKRNNPAKLIEEANAAIESEMARTGLKRSKIPFVIVIKTPSGELRVGKADEKALKFIKGLQGGQGALNSMAPYKPYMLVPSGIGVRTVPLRNAFLGETELAKNIEQQLKKIFPLEEEGFNAGKKGIEKLMYGVSLIKKDNTVEIHTKQADGSVKTEVANRPEELIEIILGTYENKKYSGARDASEKMLTPGKLARVNYYDINGKGQNEYYANNGFISTDLYQDRGNFFNSSSFVLDTRSYGTPLDTTKTAEELKKTNEQASKKAAGTELSEKEITNNDTKKDESPVFSTPITNIVTIISREFFVKNGVKIRAYALIDGDTVTIYKYEAYQQVPNSNIFNLVDLTSVSFNKGEINKKFHNLEEIKRFKEIADISETIVAEKVVPLTKPAVPDAPPGDSGDFAFLIPDDFDPADFGDVDAPVMGTAEEASGFTVDQLKIKGEQYDLGGENTPKARTVTIGEYWEKDTELDWIQEKLGKAVREGITMFNSEAELKQYLTPQAYEYLRNISKQPGSLQGLFTKAGLYLKNEAVSGTAYHEAFHVVFNLALSKEDRISILKEAAELFSSELSEKPTYLEVEELLADKFMEYVQSEGKIEYKKPDGPKTLGQRIADFFKGIFRLFKTLFNRKSTISVQSLFSDIQTGKFKDSVSFENTDTSAFESMRASSISKVYSSFLDIRLEEEALQYLKQNFFNLVDEIRNSDKDKYAALSDTEIINLRGSRMMLAELITKAVADYANNQQQVNSAYLKQLIEDLGIIVDGGLSFRKDRLEFIDGYIAPTDLSKIPILEAFLRTIKFESGIIMGGFEVSRELITDMIEDSENTESIEEKPGGLESWQQEVAYIDPKTTMSQYLKRLFSNFHYYKPNTTEPLLNRFGAKKVFPQNEVFSFLSQRITDSLSVEDMMEKLETLRNERDFIPQLIDKIRATPTLGINLFVSLANKSQMNHSTVYADNKGVIRTFASNRQTIGNVIQNFLIANILDQKSPLFKKFTSGPLVGQKDFTDIDKEFVEAKFVELNKLQVTLKEARGEDILKTLEGLSKFYYSLNLPITPKHLRLVWAPNRRDVRPSVENINEVINATQAILIKLKKGENPFLEITAEDKESSFMGRKTKIRVSSVSTLAKTLKLGLEDEVNLSFRDPNNKTKYAVQYSGYLNKLVSKFKNAEHAKRVWQNIKQDPLLSKMPLYNEIFDMKTGEVTEFITGANAGLDVIILDSLAREGKTRAIPYDELSPAELELVCLAQFDRNQGMTSESKDLMGYYKLPIPSDSTTLPFIKAKKYTNEAIVNNLVEVAKGEIARINNVRNLSKNSSLNLLPIYIEKGSKFQILSFLNDSKSSLEDLMLNDELLKKEISDYLFNKFLPKEYKEAEKNGILSLNKGQVTFADNLLSIGIKDKKAFYDSYLLNNFFINTQFTTIFAGDPAFYKNTEDYQKRYKQVISPGTYTDTSIEATYQALVFNDEIVPTSSENIEKIKKLIIEDKNLTPKKKAELLSIWTKLGEKESGNNNTDGATYISVDRYLDILDSMNRRTEAHEKAAERIRKGEEDIKDIALFPPLKPFVFTKIVEEGIEIPVQVKNSEVLLTKAAAKGNSKLEAAYELLNSPVTDKSGQLTTPTSLIFISAIKTPIFGNSIENGKVQYSELVVDENGKYKLKEAPFILTLNQEDWKLQQETPPHYVDEVGNYGTQLRTLTIGDIDKTAEYEKGLTGEQLIREFEDLNIQNIIEDAGKVKEMFLDDEGNFSIEQIADYLRKEVEDRGLDPGYLEALELVPSLLDPSKKTTALPLWSPSLNIKAQNLLYSFITNKVIKQKINGGNMVNTTGFGVSEKLKFKIDENTGTITFQALLPWWSKKFFPKQADGSIDLKALPKELLEIVGYRIPTEDKYSMFNIEVEGFTTPAQGGTIILPPEAVTIAGLDFDIDKLFMLIPNYYLVGEKGKERAVYIKPLKATNSTREIVEHVFRDYKALKKLLKTYLPDGVNTKSVSLSVDEILQNRRSLLEKKKEILDESSEVAQLHLAIKNLNAQMEQASKKHKEVLHKQLDEAYSKLEESIPYEEFLEDTFAYLKQIKESIIESLQGVSIDTQLVQGKKSRDNRIIQLTQAVLRNKNTSTSILDPGGFSEEKALGQKIRILKIEETSGKLADLRKEGLALFKKFEEGNIDVVDYQNALKKLTDKLDDVDFNINYPSTQRELFIRNMTGNALIGIFANHNTHHAKSQLTTLKLRHPIQIGDNVYQNLNQVYADVVDGKVRISKSIANLLAAAVDNAKDPIASYLNLNTFTADIVSTMLRLGIEKELVFTFINQPIILRATAEYFKAKGSIKELNKSFKIIKKELEAILINTYKIDKAVLEDIENNPIDINLEELQSHLVKEDSEKHRILQFKVLSLFNEIYDNSKELSQIVQASRTDTKSPGPTHGAAFSKMYSQSKLLEKERRGGSLITGAADFLVLKESGARVNAAFTQYAWRELVGLINNIFPSIGKTVGDGTLKLSQLGRMKVRFSNMKDSIYSITEREANSIDTGMLSFLASGFSFFSHSQAENILKNTPERLSTFMANNLDSLFIPFLKQLDIKNADEVRPRRISFYTTGKTPIDIRNYKRLFYEMLISPDPSAHELATDLVKYSYFSSGFAFGPNTFFHLVPEITFTDKFAKEYPHLGLLDTRNNSKTFNMHMEQKLKELESGDATIISKFERQFVQNIGAKSTMIPQVDAIEPIPTSPKTFETLGKSDIIITLGQENLNEVIPVEGRSYFEYKVGKTDNYEEFIENMTKLMTLATNSPKLTFHISASLNDLKFEGKKFNEAFRLLNNTVGIPKNVRFKENKDVRNWREHVVKDNLLKINVNNLNDFQVVDDLGDTVYPSFIRLGMGKKARIFEKIRTIESESDNRFIWYQLIPIVSTSLFNVSYNFDGEVTESLASKIAKQSSDLAMADSTESLFVQGDLTEDSNEPEGADMEDADFDPLDHSNVAPTFISLPIVTENASEVESSTKEPVNEGVISEEILRANPTYEYFKVIHDMRNKPLKISEQEFLNLPNEVRITLLLQANKC